MKNIFAISFLVIVFNELLMNINWNTEMLFVVKCVPFLFIILSVFFLLKLKPFKLNLLIVLLCLCVFLLIRNFMALPKNQETVFFYKPTRVKIVKESNNAGQFFTTNFTTVRRKKNIFVDDNIATVNGEYISHIVKNNYLIFNTRSKIDLYNKIKYDTFCFDLIRLKFSTYDTNWRWSAVRN